MYLKRNKELSVLSLYLRDYRRQFYLREISKFTKVALKTTQNITASLEKSNILRSKTNGKNKYFKLNLENINTKFYLLQAEIHRTLLFLEKYPLFKTFMKELKTNTIIVVFGSFAKFTADKNSDVDMLIISKEEQELPMHLLPYKVHDIKLTEESFKKSIESQEALIKEAEENHIIINNHSLYVNSMWDFYGK